MISLISIAAAVGIAFGTVTMEADTKAHPDGGQVVIEQHEDGSAFAGIWYNRERRWNPDLNCSSGMFIDAETQAITLDTICSK